MEPKRSRVNFSDLRRRAEDFLSARPEGAGKVDFDPEAVRRLVHELDTYQIELEMQNEDLRQTQEELLKTQHRYTDLYEHAPVAYFTLDDKAWILEANLAAGELLGVERQNLVGRLFTDFVAPEDQDEFYRRRLTLLQEQRRVSFDLRLEKKEKRFVHALVTFGGDTEGLDFRDRFLLMASDISSRKAAEMEKLRELKDRYRAIVMDQSELICRFDPEDRITFVNDAYCRYFGVNHQEILGTTFLPNVHEDDLPLVQDHFRDLTPEEPVRVIEKRVIRPDGEISWHQWSGRALFDSHGRMVECQAVGRDITELKQTEARLQHELKLRQLFLDALPCMAILVRYPSREIVAVNGRAAAAGAQVGTHCFETFAKQDAPCSWCLADEMWKTRGPQNTQHWALDLYWDTYWIPVDSDLYLQCAFDISEQQKIKEALQQAKEDCEKMVAQRTMELRKSHEQLLHSEKLAAVGSLSASIAHEFNNPLQSITTIIKGIVKYARLDQKETELLDMALQECRRMAGLIANLQDFYRPSSGKVESVDIQAVLEALLLMAKKDFNTRSIVVVKEFAKGLPVVSGVVDQLKQVFLNILNNAADACEVGGTITLITEAVDRERVAIRVGDTGVGITPENLHKIFQPFFTTKADRKGTGLGLSVSYGIIKKHGGDIEVHSERGKGSIFSVYLPINKDEA